MTVIGVIKEWQTIIAAIVVIIGWFMNSWLNRRADIAKKRLEIRFNSLKSIVEDVIIELANNSTPAFYNEEFINKLGKARTQIQLFGKNKEIMIFEEFIAAVNLPSKSVEQVNFKLQKVNQSIPKLKIIVDSLRDELGLT